MKPRHECILFKPRTNKKHNIYNNTKYTGSAYYKDNRSSMFKKKKYRIDETRALYAIHMGTARVGIKSVFRFWYNSHKYTYIYMCACVCVWEANHCQ